MPPQTHTHQKKMDPDCLYFDPRSQGDRQAGGQSSAGTWPRSHGLPTCPCGARDSCGRDWEDRTLQPPRWDSNPHRQSRTKTKRQTPASTKTEDGQQTRRDNPDGSHRQFFNPSCEVGGIRSAVTLPPIGRVACRWPAPRRGSVVVSGLLASRLEHLGFASS